MAKQTLYDIIGVAADASADDIQRAFEERRKALSDLPESEDQRNHRSFLDHARDVLGDPGRRATYDWQLRARDIAPQAVPQHRLRWRGLVAGLLALVGTVMLGKQFLPTTPGAGPATPIATVATKAAAKPVVVEDLPSVADAAEALAGPDRGSAPAATVPAAATRGPQPRTVTATAGSPLMNRVLQSTYAIVGSQGHGTGVAIEPDRLLTNCHVIAPNVLKGKIYAISAVTGASVEITEAAFLVKEDACVVHAPGLAGQPMALGDTAHLQRGARLHNVGFGGGNLTLAQGLYLGSLQRFGQYYMLSTNSCLPGVSGGPLVDDDGRLIGLTSGGARDSRGNNVCASLTVETARQVLSERMMQIDAFPPNYLTNWTGRR
ncbi:MAG: trypsin-like peptidase domain-containing protein [Rhodocyclales bacterium]|jgi:serine protease Do|nr:trypsin-like peptidase domain-containing protein [Rhodocyclales bacterium]